MITTVGTADWIKRIAEDERSRDAARVRDDEGVARKAELVRRHARRLVDELRTTVTRDIEAFREEFPGDAARDVGIDLLGPDGGFVVRRPAPSAVSLSVTPSLDAALMDCRYAFTLKGGLPSREDRVSLTFARDGDESLLLKNQATGQVFTTADALSEFLLVPLLTARRR
jgi:hypothetical protein